MTSGSYVQLWRDTSCSPATRHAKRKARKSVPRLKSPAITRVGVLVDDQCRMESSFSVDSWRGQRGDQGGRGGGERRETRPGSSGGVGRRTVSAGCRKRAGNKTSTLHHPHTSSHTSLPHRTHSPRPPTLHSPLPPRAHSSLGFVESHGGTSLPRPQGFDLQAYVRRQGSASNIRIGINGSSTSDEYFERYLEECESIAQREKGEMTRPHLESMQEGEFPGDSDDDDVTMMSLLPSAPAPPVQQKNRQQVPLCWEDQLKKAEVINVDKISFGSFLWKCPWFP